MSTLTERFLLKTAAKIATYTTYIMAVRTTLNPALAFPETTHAQMKKQTVSTFEREIQVLAKKKNSRIFRADARLAGDEGTTKTCYEYVGDRREEGWMGDDENYALKVRSGDRQISRTRNCSIFKYFAQFVARNTSLGFCADNTDEGLQSGRQCQRALRVRLSRSIVFHC